MAQTQTTPPRGLSRRAFLAGLGISGLSLAFMTSFPNIVFAAPSGVTKISSFDTSVPKPDIAIDISKTTLANCEIVKNTTGHTIVSASSGNSLVLRNVSHGALPDNPTGSLPYQVVSIPGEIQLKFKDAAVVDGLIDNSSKRYDFIWTLKNIKHVCTQWTGSDWAAWTDDYEIFCFPDPDTGWLYPGYISGTGVKDGGWSDNARHKSSTGWEIQTVFQFIQPSGLEATETFNLFVNDLDIWDHRITSAPTQQAYDGAYSESIIFTDSTFDKVYVLNDSVLKYVPSENRVHGTTETTGDDEENRAGFLAPVTSPVTFTWRGTRCGTHIAMNAPLGVIKSSAGAGGTITNRSGDANNKSLREVAGRNETYTMVPNDGYIVKKVTVDGTDYTSRLNANKQFTFLTPTYNHTIHVEFEKWVYPPTNPSKQAVTREVYL